MRTTTCFLDEIPESISENISRIPDIWSLINNNKPLPEQVNKSTDSSKTHLSVPKIFNNASYDIQKEDSYDEYEVKSTCETYLSESHLSVPPVFTESFFLQASFTKIKECLKLKMSEDALKNSNELEKIVYKFDGSNDQEILKNIKDLINSSFGLFEDSINSAYFNELENLGKIFLAENKMCFKEFDCFRSFIFKEENIQPEIKLLLLGLRLYIEARVPAICHLVRSSNEQSDLTKKRKSQYKEFFCYIILFYFVVTGSRNKIFSVVEDWLQSCETKGKLDTMYNYYSSVFLNMKIGFPAL